MSRDTTSYYQPRLSRDERKKLIQYHTLNVRVAEREKDRRLADLYDRRITELRQNKPISLYREECEHIGKPTNYSEAVA